MIDRLATGIKTKFTGSALADLVTGLFFGEAPALIELPYLMFFDITNLPDSTFAKDGEFYRIQFSIFVQERSIVADNGMKEIYEALRTLYDDAMLTLSEWTNYECRFLSQHNQPTVNKVLHRSVDYAIRAEKT